jgi:serine/threonine-protein kinase
MMDVNVGEILAGKYRVERVIGRGAMGVVVAATHLQLGQQVALKFLTAEALQHPEALTRFGREARAAAAIRSEHVARVLDVGALESGQPYMVMEYLEGCDLATYKLERGPLSIVEAADLTLQACEALAEAHSLGIIHRDLKPANLFLARYADRTSLKILDFGISKIVVPVGPENDFDMTRMGAIMGSPSYMSPEQMRSTRNVDTRTDIWAIGVVLYELVTGHLPFQAPSMPQLCGMILSDPAPPVRQWRPDVPPRFEALIMRCLAKDPRQRFSSVAELAVALGEFAPAGSTHSVSRILKLAGAGSSGIDHRLVDGPRSEQAPHTGWGRTAHRYGTRSIFGIAFGVALVIGCAAWFLLYRAASPRGPDPLPLAQPTSPSPTHSASPPIVVATPAHPDATAVDRPGASAPIETASAPAPHASTPKAIKSVPKHAPAAAASVGPTPPLATVSPAQASSAKPPPTPLDGRL